MNFPRASGILFHPTSLPGPHGVGNFGPEAFRFVEFLHAAGQKFWQVLPLNPTGYADSPFMSSVSNTAIAPMQDILGLGNEARMNLPGTSCGNWERRMKPGAAAAAIATRLREMGTLSDR
ncbi:MAG: 4-alpha-glucanotransferase [Candidatus Sulfotelmatobacter sp.]